MFSRWKFQPVNPVSIISSKKCCYSVRFVQFLSSDTNLSSFLQGHIPNSHVLQIHARIFRFGVNQDNLIATRLIGHYPSRYGLRLFYQLQNPNIFPFNAIIRVLAEDGLSSQAFSIFKLLKQRSLLPNDFTFSFLLKVCFRSKNGKYVKQIHTQAMKTGYICDSLVCNGILVAYAKGLKDLVSARKVFDEFPDKSMVCCWTSLIAGCAQSGQSEEVLQLFFLMVQENLQPEDSTLVNVLSACSNLENSKIERWVTIFSELDYDIDDIKICIRDSINTVLTYLYGKCGKIEKSREKFDDIGDNGKRSVLPWNAIIGAYVQNGCHVEALSLFRLMMENPSCKPNHVTMVSVLSACAQIGDFDLGQWVHEYMKSKGSKGVIESNAFLGTAFIDMYSKCGKMERAKDVFDQLVAKDVVSFNAMIMGLAMNGEGEEALRLFSEMPEFNLHPNDGTFLGVLCACNHSGLSEKGRQIFSDMSLHFSVSPKLEHYSCYIDLLSRVGYVDKAIEVVSSMPYKPNHFVFGALLGGCLLHSRIDLAQAISQKLVEVNPENSGGYVMLSNAFANDCRWRDVSKLRWSMREKGVRKQPGCSWISINGVNHEFLAGSTSHTQIESIYHMLHALVKEMKAANPW